MGEKKWISIHLYYNQPWNDLLLNRVIPFVQPTLETGLVQRFFFVRYWHRGPHIRLRFFGQKDQLESILLPNLKSYFSDYFDYHPSLRNDPIYQVGFPENEKWFANDSIQEIKYEPEFHRYGGPEGITIAEKQFFESSKVVFNKYVEKGENWNYEEALGIGILLHISMVHAMRLDKTEALQFFNMCSQNWFPKVVASKKRVSKNESLETIRSKIYIGFQRNFRAQKDQIIPYIEQLWTMLDEEHAFEEAYMNDWYESQKSVGRDLILLQSNGGLKERARNMHYSLDVEEAYSSVKLERWMHLADYLHMTNNRLGILNRDESYLTFLLTESLQRIL